MRRFFLLFFLPLTLLLSSCDRNKEEQAIDYETMVKLEEADEEWNSLQNLDEKHLAGDLLPDSQEIVLPNWVDVEPMNLD